jgi:hypothetical protein
VSSLVIRWTIGDGSARAFDCLSLSISGARRLFGPAADYVVCVNTIPVDEARRRLGNWPAELCFAQCGYRYVPAWMRDHIDPRCGHSAVWRLAPVRVAPACLELSLDGDVILWRIPPAIEEWISDEAGCVTAQSSRRPLGKFAGFCGERSCDAAVRALPPGFAYEASLRRLIAEHPVLLDCEDDEYGLQAAALERQHGMRHVTAQEVRLCAPFAAAAPELGSHGAHFPGIGDKSDPQEWARSWERNREAVRRAISQAVPALQAA